MINLTILYVYTLHFSRNLTGTQALFFTLLTFYIFYVLFVCMNRSSKYIKKNEFIIYLLLPFSYFIVGFINLFKKD